MSIDYTSSLYLGMNHSSSEMPGWQQLTTGVPAALAEYSLANKVAGSVAKMQGLEKGVLMPGTLHAYWDLFGLLSQKKITVFIDEMIYPVSLYGIEKLYSQRVSVYSFRHQQEGHLSALIKQHLRSGFMPVVFTDGWCPSCGNAALVNQYDSLVTPHGGLVVVDDTQALGILGERNQRFGYGTGGGGILKYLNCNASANVVVIASLAKAFGVPVAVLSGTEKFVQLFTEYSITRVHSSPASIPNIQASANALKINKMNGDLRRQKLLTNVIFFQKKMKEACLLLQPSFFPVQSVRCKQPGDTISFYKQIVQHGFKCVLTKSHLADAPAVSFILRSEHSITDIERLSAQSKKLHHSLLNKRFYENIVR